MPSPRQAFLLALPPQLRARWEGRRDLASALERAEHAGVTRWTSLVESEAFAAYLGARTADPDEPAPFPHADELYLACGIASGRAAAVAAFERAYVPGIAAAVARLRLSDDELDELKQTLRQQLLVADPGRPPRIVDYSGRGALGAWLRVAAVRTAMRKRRAHDGDGEEQDLERIASQSASPELRYAFVEHGAAFRAALRAALAELDAEDQNLLRQHHVDELTLDQLSVLYRAHRTTIAYRLGRARERLWKRTRMSLRRAHRLSDSECDSLFGHARSHMAVTMRGLFD